MMCLRRFGFLCVLVAAVALLPSSAQARSSDRNNRNSGNYRLMEGDTDSERSRKREEEKRKKEEEARKQAEAKKSETAKKPTAPKVPVPVAKPPAPAKPTTVAKKPGTGAKTDEAREQEAGKLREEADKAFDKGDEAGLLAGTKLLRQILADYGGIEAAKSAQQQLDLLLADANLGPMIVLAEAQEEFDAQHYRKARNKFQELVQRYPASEQSATGRARLAEIEQNGLLKKSLYTEEELEDARLWFLSGNIHLENGRTGEAVSAYRRVIEEYPGCRFATLAEQRLPGAQGT